MCNIKMHAKIIHYLHQILHVSPIGQGEGGKEQAPSGNPIKPNSLCQEEVDHHGPKKNSYGN